MKQKEKMNTYLANKGNVLATGGNVLSILCPDGNYVDVWRKEQVENLLFGVWYDYVDTREGAFGQCRKSNKGTVGEIDGIEWMQPPANWQDYPEQGEMCDDNYEEACNDVHDNNVRFLFLDYLGRFNK